jgi:hypothetical protein
MTIEASFESIYQLLRGSRCATAFLNVRSLFESGKLTESISELKKVQESYESSRKSTLAAELEEVHPADRAAHQLKKKQAKAADALEQIQELLQLLVIRERRMQAQQSNVLKSPDKSPRGTEAIEAEWRKILAPLQTEEDVRRALEQRDQVVALKPGEALQPGDKLVVFSNGQGRVLQVDSPAIENESLRILDWLEQQRLLPIPLVKLFRSAERGRVMRLRPWGKDVAEHSSKTDATKPTLPGSAASDDEVIESENAERDRILDMGAFTQLLDAAQRSGIVPGAGVVIQVRDCEYRLGKYNKALQMMETLYTAFVGAETQRNQRLQREDADIASGRKKMTQRELQAKRIMDNQNTQAIERAKVRFQRVLEGLRGLLPLERDPEN